MATSRLKLYNDALTICGEYHLAALTDDVESRRLLDHVWDNDGIKNCLEEADWKFATRSVQLDYDSAFTQEFGYLRRFNKPSDFCRTSAICSDEYFQSPILQYNEESGFWYCDLDLIYVQYVSNDSAYGSDMSLWSSRFADFVAAHFASKIILKLTSDKEKRDGVLKFRETEKLKATNLDAMAGPTRFPPDGNWVNARRSRGSRKDRGNRNQLIG